MIEVTINHEAGIIQLYGMLKIHNLRPQEAREIARQLTDAADWIEGTPPEVSRAVLPVLTIEDLLAQRSAS